MVCIHCGLETKVTNSRPQKRANQIWRRRQCLQCAAIFTTEEKIDLSQVWQVAGKHGMHPFERDRLFLSLHRSLQHRVSARQDAAALTQTVIDKLLKQKITGPISNRTIIQHVQVALNRFDSAASVHYQAFHKI